MYKELDNWIFVNDDTPNVLCKHSDVIENINIFAIFQ